jgi:hypothetical protein
VYSIFVIMLLSLDMFPLYLSNELETVYNPSGKYMKTIDVGYRPWDIAIIPRTHRAVVTFTNKKIQFINLQTDSTSVPTQFTQLTELVVE